jgi:hypothetical protein
MNYTNSKTQSSSWEANSRSDTQGILRFLWNQNVYYHVYKSLSSIRIMTLKNLEAK